MAYVLCQAFFVRSPQNALNLQEIENEQLQQRKVFIFLMICKRTT